MNVLEPSLGRYQRAQTAHVPAGPFPGGPIAHGHDHLQLPERGTEDPGVCRENRGALTQTQTHGSDLWACGVTARSSTPACVVFTDCVRLKTVLLSAWLYAFTGALSFQTYVKVFGSVFGQSGPVLVLFNCMSAASNNVCNVKTTEI